MFRTEYEFFCDFKNFWQNEILLVIWNHSKVIFSVGSFSIASSSRYMVSFSNAFSDHKEGEPQSIIIWDVLTGQRKRSFNADSGSLNWPVFKWSHDDKFFARISQDTLSIYETSVIKFYFFVFSFSFYLIK